MSQKMLSTELIKSVSEILKNNGIKEAVKKAEIILSEITKKKIPDLYLDEEEISSRTIKKYIEYLNKIIEGIPLQYIIKKSDFYKYQFYVDKGVFIPRPETEILIEKTIEIYKNFFFPSFVNILDIGTGSGNIAITLGKEIKNSSLIATDISEKSIKIAKKNAARYKVENKIKFIKTDLFPKKNIKFDIIVSNPPYIPEREIENLENDVKKEPYIALNGGKSGMKYIKKILKNSGKYLSNNGFLILEIGYNQSKFLKNKKFNDLKIVEFTNDLNGIERVVIFKKHNKKEE
ncbi:MAG TPA: peptide chain release factor N(5)-glutamine methyltransferase [Candidatus Ratteibacteria bacterium]|nr:peptide chain release factor N(5)-glutamine methyltransferase [Candidatus Ratteibacteria bacterium]